MKKCIVSQALKSIKPARLLLIFLICGMPSILMAQKNRQQPSEYWGESANRQMAGASFFKERIGSPFPSFVRFEESQWKPLQNFFSWLKQSIKANSEIDFKLVKEEADQLRFTHYRYVQTFRGVPIENTMYILHVREGLVYSFNGFATEVKNDLSAKAGMNESLALQNAMKQMGATKYKWQDNFWESEI